MCLLISTFIDCPCWLSIKSRLNLSLPSSKLNILPTFEQESVQVMYYIKCEAVGVTSIQLSSFIWVCYKKFFMNTMWRDTIWWGCRGNLKFITLRSEKVKNMSLYSIVWLLFVQTLVRTGTISTLELWADQIWWWNKRWQCIQYLDVLKTHFFQRVEHHEWQATVA